MENSYRLYQNYVQGVRCAYGISFPFLSLSDWLEKHGVMRNPGEFQDFSKLALKLYLNLNICLHWTGTYYVTQHK